MFPLRDLQDDPEHEELQGLREEAVLQRVSAPSPGDGEVFYGNGIFCGIFRGNSWMFLSQTPGLPPEMGAPSSAGALSMLIRSVLGREVKPRLEGSQPHLILVLNQLILVLKQGLPTQLTVVLNQEAQGSHPHLILVLNHGYTPVSTGVKPVHTGVKPRLHPS